MLDVNQNKARSPQAISAPIDLQAEATTLQRPTSRLRADHPSTSVISEKTSATVSIREAEDDDAAQLAEIVAAIMSEFPGCIFDLDADFPELKQPKSSFRRDGGCFWVAESHTGPGASAAGQAAGTGRRIVGCFGFLPAEDPRGIELQRVYLRPDLRGTGLAVKMFKIVQAVARQRSAGFIELWTDSRFKAAQRFYEKLGFRRLPNERLLNDRNRSSELHYLLPLI